jgi:D-xylose transport system permease protein
VTQSPTAIPEPDAAESRPDEGRRRPISAFLRATEIDVRMLGMIVALAGIWILFEFMSGHTFLSPRNLWNLSVQTSAIAIMATGMVLVIVSRNIDLSVGAVMGFVGVVMAIVQVRFLPNVLGFDHPATWIITLIVGIVLGGLAGGLQGVVVAYLAVPSFIVTLGGFMAWRGVAWVLSSGKTIAPLDTHFQLLGGGSRGTIGGMWSWVVAIIGCVGIIALIINRRRQRQKYGFPVRAVPVEVTLGAISCGAVLIAVYWLNRYYMPELLAREYADAHGIPWPETGLSISLGIAVPVLILLGVTLVMTFLATRVSFGRYVFAIGGNPEAAELSGIRTRWTIVKVFALMGVLVAFAAAVQTARLNAAVGSLGELSELYVIAAAVIGGTSFSGGVGTIPGAVIGALVMQSLSSGMVLMGVENSVQKVVVGVVLVLAVTVDTMYRRRMQQ